MPDQAFETTVTLLRNGNERDPLFISKQVTTVPWAVHSFTYQLPLQEDDLVTIKEVPSVIFVESLNLRGLSGWHHGGSGLYRVKKSAVYQIRTSIWAGKSDQTSQVSVELLWIDGPKVPNEWPDLLEQTRRIAKA